MKIVVTGSAGFIGYHLAKRLLKEKFIVYGIDNLNNYYSNNLKKERIKELLKNKNFIFYKKDLNEYNQIFKILKNISPTIIYHLASQPGIIYSFLNPKTYKNNNINVTKNLIKISNKLKIEKFYFTSSSSVYGNKKKFPIKEDAKLSPMNYYAETKLICEKLLKKQLSKNTDLKIFRPFTVYGTFSRPDMLFIKYLNSYTNKKPFVLYNYGNYIRDFTYIDDVVDVLFKSLRIGKIRKKIINICSSNPININDVIKIINKTFYKKKKIEFKKRRKGEMIKTFGDNKYVLKLIKNKKFINIKYGIKKTVDWYKSYKQKNYLKFNKF